MIHLNLDPTPVTAGETVALTPKASVVSLGEIRVGRRRFQARRTTELSTGFSVAYLLDARGAVFYLEPRLSGRTSPAISRDTGREISSGGRAVEFLLEGDTLTVA